MQNNAIYLLVTLLIAILAMGCKSKKIISSEDGVQLQKHSSRYIFNQIEKQAIDAQWMDAKANIRINEDGKKTKAYATIRMRKDSIIWVAVKKLGVEGGRMLITTDSVFIINRMDKVYVAQPFSYVRQLTGMASTGNNLTDFRNLYNLILGNVVTVHQGRHRVDVEGASYKLDKEKNGLSAAYWIDGQRYVLNKFLISQAKAGRQASCQYEGYKPLGNHALFPYIRQWNIQSPESGELALELDFSRVKVDEPTRFPFKIPKRYQEISRF